MEIGFLSVPCRKPIVRIFGAAIQKRFLKSWEGTQVVGLLIERSHLRHISDRFAHNASSNGTRRGGCLGVRPVCPQLS